MSLVGELTENSKLRIDQEITTSLQGLPLAIRHLTISFSAAHYCLAAFWVVAPKIPILDVY